MKPRLLPDPQDDPLLGEEELAERWHVSVHGLRSMRRRAPIEFVRVGRRPLFRLSAVTAREREHTEHPPVLGAPARRRA